MILGYLLAFALTVGLTYLLRLYALKKNIIDIPNARSSHQTPTPRGGGLSVVVVFLLVLIGFTGMEMMTLQTGGLIALAGAMVAVVGWIDDHGHIRALIRLAVHLSSAGLVLFAIGGMPEFVMFGFVVDYPVVSNVLALFALVWVLNLFNFMDGIDGIAGVEVTTTTLTAGLILFVVFGFQEAAYLHFFLAASALGFLCLNFPPAKIFMGDAGSGFLGLNLGMLMLFSASLDQKMLWVWLILLGVFIVDASFTLARRLLRGDKVYEAHRSHAYQWASRRLGSHRPVTLFVLVLNLFWLGPLALYVALDKLDGLLATLIAYGPLLWIAWVFKAGEKED